ncbi:Hypothetical predicted protein [Mytilus galloprovincialis]|uniref:Uncharacterized protein n=1 Tax=Mytilus galloprovincialis TaxID=29158 RepID=A0A8B6CE85_MYTGA|nr:Hypothetical predicted protein [Mytilus galloprovincialis]
MTTNNCDENLNLKVANCVGGKRKKVSTLLFGLAGCETARMGNEEAVKKKKKASILETHAAKTICHKPNVKMIPREFNNKPYENQSHVPHPQISQQNPSHQPVQQPISIHKVLQLPVTQQLSQQNESCVAVTQLSQQNKWHDIPVHQHISQQNPLQIPLHQLSPQQSQSSLPVPKQLFQQNQSLGPQQQLYPYNSNMYNQSSTLNGQNSFQYMSMLMNNDHQFQQDIQVPPIRQSLETAYNWPISSHTSSFCESGTSFDPLIEQVIMMI